jgi:hypothetical protein
MGLSFNNIIVFLRFGSMRNIAQNKVSQRG